MRKRLVGICPGIALIALITHSGSLFAEDLAFSGQIIKYSAAKRSGKFPQALLRSTRGNISLKFKIKKPGISAGDFVTVRGMKLSRRVIEVRKITLEKPNAPLAESPNSNPAAIEGSTQKFTCLTDADLENSEQNSLIKDAMELSVSVPKQAGSNVVFGDPSHILIIPVYGTDQIMPTSPTSADLLDLMTGPVSSVRTYFNDVSYGAASFDAQVVNWVQGDYTSNQTNCFLGTNPIKTALNAVHNADPFLDLTQFGRVLLVINQPGCYAGGMAMPGTEIDVTVGGTEISTYGLMVNMPKISAPVAYDSAKVKYSMAHELGHMYGLDHSGFYNCGTSTILPGCSTTRQQPYSDPFSIMGGWDCEFAGCPGGYMSELNAVERSMANWFVDGQVRVAPLGATQTYTLEPIETHTSGIKAIRIPRGVSQFPNSNLWVEFRQAIGADSHLADAHLNRVTRGALIHLDTFVPMHIQSLLDTNLPAGQSTGNLAAVLESGQQWTDPYSGVLIQVTDLVDGGADPSASRLTVSVTRPASFDAIAPSATLISPTFASYRNDGVPIAVSATASDNTAVDYVKIESGPNGANGAVFQLFLAAPFSGQMTINDVAYPGVNTKRDISAYAVDMLGNKSPYDTRTLYVDKSLPTPVLVSGSATGDRASVQMYCSDNVPGKPVLMGVINSGGQVLAQTVPEGNGARSSLLFDLSNLAYGQISIGLFCQDEAGNRQEIPNMLSLDHAAPEMPQTPTDSPENPVLRRPRP